MADGSGSGPKAHYEALAKALDQAGGDVELVRIGRKGPSPADLQRLIVNGQPDTVVLGVYRKHLASVARRVDAFVVEETYMREADGVGVLFEGVDELLAALDSRGGTDEPLEDTISSPEAFADGTGIYLVASIEPTHYVYHPFKGEAGALVFDVGAPGSSVVDSVYMTRDEVEADARTALLLTTVPKLADQIGLEVIDLVDMIEKLGDDVPLDPAYLAALPADVAVAAAAKLGDDEKARALAAETKGRNRITVRRALGEDTDTGDDDAGGGEG